MRIIQISDLHFGMHEQAIIDPFLQDLRQLQPERVIISGDVTQRALPGQYLLFQDFLKQLPPALVVPGNHDIPLYDFYERLINPFKNYRRYVSPELEAHFINDKINILGVNSVTPYKLKDGLLSKKT
ncbi:MAG: metallophosphoesterase, partial [Legionella sp.]